MAASAVSKLKYEDFNVGDYIEITKNRAGKIVWMGEVDFKTASGDKKSIGIELIGCVGKMDGEWQGKRYFTCEKDRGMIVQMDRVRKRIKNPLVQDFSRMGLSKQTLGISEEPANNEPEQTESECQGWGSWTPEEVGKYVNSRLKNHGELFVKANITGEELGSRFRDDMQACKKFFAEHDVSQTQGRNLKRFLNTDLTEENRHFR